MSLSNALVLLSSKTAHFAVQVADTWTWREVSVDASTSVEMIAEQLSAALHSAGFTAGGLVLGVPASRCLAATFDSSDLPDGDYPTRLFRFEEQMPLSAEQIVAEFIDGHRADGLRQTLGIAIERIWIERCVTAFESIGLAVDAVVPTALLAMRPDKLTLNEATLIAEPGDDQWQLMLHNSKHISHWTQFPAGSSSLKQSLQMLRMRGWQIESVRCISASIAGDSFPGVKILGETQSFQALAAANAKDVLQGRSSLINFRNNGLPAPDRLRLNRRALDGLLVGVGVMLILLSLSLWVRAARYRGVSDHNQQLMMTRFHETLPGWPTPSNFRAVVAAERRRLAPDAAGAVTEPTALTMMLRVLQPLPPGSEVTLNELSFAAHHFDLAGTLNRYESAQPLSEAARASGLDVAPVQAHRLADNSWQFTLSGQTQSPTKAVQP